MGAWLKQPIRMVLGDPRMPAIPPILLGLTMVFAESNAIGPRDGDLAHWPMRSTGSGKMRRARNKGGKRTACRHEKTAACKRSLLLPPVSRHRPGDFPSAPLTYLLSNVEELPKE
jgi:hypothetical protein